MRPYMYGPYMGPYIYGAIAPYMYGAMAQWMKCVFYIRILIYRPVTSLWAPLVYMLKCPWARY